VDSVIILSQTPRVLAGAAIAIPFLFGAKNRQVSLGRSKKLLLLSKWRRRRKRGGRKHGLAKSIYVRFSWHDASKSKTLF